MTPAEMSELMRSFGEPSYRAHQLYEWLNVKNAVSYDEMTNLSKSLRERLKQECPLPVLSVRAMQESAIDGTRKYLFRLSDGNYVESVYMMYHHGNSVCISTQVGCRMGCRFCASALLGFTRNLTAGEMLGQIYEIERDTKSRVSNIVVMGTGEPLDNYDGLVRFLRMISDSDGHHISERNLTVSTCGLVPGILNLKNENLMINLALSLHAPTDEMRKTLMPVANKYSLAEIFSALRDYYSVNRRRLTFEYSLISGVNDSDSCAEKLAGLVKDMNALINLIPVNPVKETEFRSPEPARAAAFKKKLEKYGINVTIRREMGRDIDGACGQLRKRYTETDYL